MCHKAVYPSVEFGLSKSSLGVVALLATRDYIVLVIALIVLNPIQAVVRESIAPFEAAYLPRLNPAIVAVPLNQGEEYFFG